MPIVPAGSKDALVTIIVGCHKQEKWLGESISSAFNQQTDVPFEVVVYHDRCGYSDSVKSSGNAAKARNNIIKALAQRPNGVEFIIILDGDDLLPSHHIQELMNARLKDPVHMFDFVCCGIQFFSGCRLDRICDCEDGPMPLNAFRTGLSVAITSLFTYTHWKAVGGFDENIDTFEDWEFFLRVHDKFPGVYTRRTATLKRDLGEGTLFKTYFNNKGKEMEKFNAKHGLNLEPPPFIPLPEPTDSSVKEYNIYDNGTVVCTDDLL